MIMQVLHCPHCQGTDIIRHGKTRQGKQRYCCRETVCDGRTFLLDYSYAGHSAEMDITPCGRTLGGSVAKLLFREFGSL